ncbi:MAG: MOSC domain-containing protein [Betaproteobacteria bacterium]
MPSPAEPASMYVERLFAAAAPGGSLIEHDRIKVVAGAGIEGDRYFGHQDEPGQNITLIEAEEIESFLHDLGRPVDLSVTRRNVVTRGVRLNELVGREFLVGDVLLRGVELCEPCAGLGESLASPLFPAARVVKGFVHRAGLRADVLSGGVIARGTAIRSAHARDADVLG